MIELTTQQLQALTHTAAPIRFLDPQTNQEYVLVRAELYQRFQGLLHDGLDSRAVAQLIERTMHEYDENDPLLESYQKYRG